MHRLFAFSAFSSCDLFQAVHLPFGLVVGLGILPVGS